MAYGLSYGNWGLGVELLRTCMPLHGVLFYWREKKYKQLHIGQGVAQGCSMSPILFSIFINQLLDEVEKAGFGRTIKNDVKVGGLMFADDFVGLATNAEDLQS